MRTPPRRRPHNDKKLLEHDGEADLHERIASLETHIRFLATREDLAKSVGELNTKISDVKGKISDVKVWVLLGVLGGMVAAAGLAVGIAQIFS